MGNWNAGIEAIEFEIFAEKKTWVERTFKVSYEVFWEKSLFVVLCDKFHFFPIWVESFDAFDVNVFFFAVQLRFYYFTYWRFFVLLLGKIRWKFDDFLSEEIRKVNLLVEHIIAGKKVAVMFFDWSLFVSLITYEKRRFFIHLVN